MRGQAVVAAVVLGDADRDSLTGLQIDVAFAERAEETQVSFEGDRVDAKEPEEVRRRAELLFSRPPAEAARRR